MKDYGADEIERDVTQQSEVFDRSPIANPAMVLTEVDIKSYCVINSCLIRN